jgi:hypothetical protein
LSAFNRLSNSIGRFKGSINTALNTLSQLGDNVKEIFQNFNNLINNSNRPSAYSTDSYNKNLTLLSSANGLLLENNFSTDNNVLLSSTDPEVKASYELMTAIKHVEYGTLASLLINETSFNSPEEVDAVIDIFQDLTSSLENYELFLGKDIYKNNITHKIEYVTPEIIEMIDAFFVIYNDLMLKLFAEKVSLSYRNETNVKKMTILQLIHCVYQGQYNLADAEQEHIYFDKICRLNPKLYTTFPYAEGLIRY